MDFGLIYQVPVGGMIQFDRIKGRGGHLLSQQSIEIHRRDRGSQYWLSMLISVSGCFLLSTLSRGPNACRCISTASPSLL